MNRPLLRWLCLIYVVLLLLAATAMSPMPYSLLALALLLVTLLSVLRPLPPGLNAAIVVAIIFLTPLLLAQLIDRPAPLPPAGARTIPVVFIIPALYLLDDSLRLNTRHIHIINGITGRHATKTLISMFTSALVIMLISTAVNNPVLLFTGITFTLYLLGTLLNIFLTIPRQPFATSVTTKRVIAGTTGSITCDLSRRTSARLESQLSPVDPWVDASPRRFTLDKGRMRLDLSFTPPLAGHSCPQIWISAVDPRGFIQVNQCLEPVQMHIIPRAKYAEWLAKKYLERTGSGVVTAATPQGIMRPKRGIEYLDSRNYQPGDQLKDIDWKHALKLSQLIVKEYTEAGDTAAIIAVNLSVTDAEAADKLAFNLITVALTLTRENIPTALAAYSHQGVILNRAISDPAEILREALSLVREITPVELADRHLEPQDIARIRRTIKQLKEVESDPARRLLGVLNFEYRAIEEAVRNHPATPTLLTATRQIPAPAIIFLVSQLNHDAEAIMAMAEKLARRRFTTVPVGPA